MKRIRSKKTMLLLATCLSASVGFAENAGGDELSLAALLDIKLQTGSFLELDLAKSPLSMTIIDREKIELAGANNLSELLEIYVPGFQYMFNKWNGVIWGMRGVANDRNAKFIVLVNGHKMNTDARDGFFSETSIGLFGEMERIEVLRGPAGLVYGSGAIAGVVNIVTREATKNGADIEAKGRTWTSGFGNTATSAQGTVFGKISDDQSFTGSVGWEKSDGVGQGVARIYGKASWPYPGWVDPSQQIRTNGVPTNGSALSTPGNWKANADWRWSGLRLTGRFTHSAQDASGLFIQQPWGSSAWNITTAHASLVSQKAALTTKISSGQGTAVDSTNLTLVNYELSQLPGPVQIDGKTVALDDPFWSSVSGGDSNRRTNIADNVALDATYDLPMGENSLKLHLAFDGNTDQTGRQSIVGYDNSASGTVPLESFGERDYTVGVLYLLKSVSKLQLAIGAEERLDDLGNGLNGTDMEGGNPLQPAVTKILYTNTAFYTEGFYNVTDKFDLDFGVRWDGMTRTYSDGGTWNGKLAGVFSPAIGHTIKAIFQSSSNAGTDDNYEFNRIQINAQGQIYTSPHFQTATDPGGLTNLVAPGVTLDELHQLKPERVYSFELTSTDDLGNGFSVSPSVSYNVVQDLFVWNQDLFRTVNASGYNFVNFDFQADYKNTWLDVGFNHTAQYLVNTNVNEQATSFQANYSNDTLSDGSHDPGVLQNGVYVPTPGRTSTITLNPVQDNVTRDSTHFLNLNSNVSKLYANLKLLPWVTLHSDVRMFWGLDGRESAYGADEKNGFNYLNITTDPSVKWNASLHFKLPDNWSVNLYAYDILGINDAQTGGTFATNTLRWQQMAKADQKDLYAMDLQSFAIEVKKSF